MLKSNQYLIQFYIFFHKKISNQIVIKLFFKVSLGMSVITFSLFYCRIIDVKM